MVSGEDALTHAGYGIDVTSETGEAYTSVEYESCHLHTSPSIVLLQWN